MQIILARANRFPRILVVSMLPSLTYLLLPPLFFVLQSQLNIAGCCARVLWLTAVVLTVGCDTSTTPDPATCIPPPSSPPPREPLLCVNQAAPCDEHKCSRPPDCSCLRTETKKHLIGTSGDDCFVCMGKVERSVPSRDPLNTVLISLAVGVALLSFILVMIWCVVTTLFSFLYYGSAGHRSVRDSLYSFQRTYLPHSATTTTTTTTTAATCLPPHPALHHHHQAA